MVLFGRKAHRVVAECAEVRGVELNISWLPQSLRVSLCPLVAQWSHYATETGSSLRFTEWGDHNILSLYFLIGLEHYEEIGGPQDSIRRMHEVETRYFSYSLFFIFNSFNVL